MASPSTDLHFVLFPLMAQGHMVPMVDMARILAQRGATITIITTPVNANRFKPVIARAIESKLRIQVVELKLRLAEIDLPEGCESFDMLSSFELRLKLFDAIDMLEQPAEDVLRKLSPTPACIISDNSIPWTVNIARKLNIPRLVFHGPGCFWLLCMHVVWTTNVLDRIESDSECFVLPGLPDRIEVTKQKVSGTSDTNIGRDWFRQRFKEGEKDAVGILVNSFQELEPEYAQELANAKDKKVWCIGPVSLCNKGILDIVERGNKAAITEHDCLKWLDAQETGSVLYICMGSLTTASTEQVIELGLGLESTNRPFIWCIRNKTEELERWFSESGFKERVSDRGLIVHGWAPQVLILSHQAVGGFVTHCGWNSTLEAICVGVQMVTWPHFADQFLNENFVVEILKIGVRIGVESPPVLFGEQDMVGVSVKKEDIKMAVECLMDEEEEGLRRRERAKELSEMARRAMEEGGSSHLNMTLMIQDITKQLAENTKLIQDVV